MELREEQKTESPCHLQPLLDNVSSRLPKEQAAVASKLLLEFSDVFAQNKQELGRLRDIFHDIDVGSTTPIRQAPRRLPPHRLSDVDEMIKQMEKMGIVEASTSSWASPIVLVKKKDGSTRFCVDFRKLNDATKKDSYPLPKIDELLGSLEGSQWFSTLDQQNGYWQIPLTEQSKQKTAFCTPQGLWQFTVMPFGLCNAPATFQRAMAQLFQTQIRQGKVRVYLDDTLIKSSSFDRHLNDVREALMVVREAGLKLNPKKCDFFKTKVNYLGHVISAEGVAADPEKTKTVSEWPTPTSAKEVKSFLGFCSYYRPFVRGFANIAAPLYRLQDSKGKIQWSKECEVAFASLKSALTSPPVLSHPVPDSTYVLDVDASHSAVGATLSQVHGGGEKVVAYYSKCLSKHERNYCVTRKELLSLVRALRHFDSYGLDNGEPVIVRTDHASLIWLRNFKNPDGQLARWLELLAPYNLKINHRPGKTHQNADGLSRRPCLPQNCKYCSRQEERNTQESEEKLNRTTLMTEIDWARAQESDKVLGKVIHWVAAGKRPNWDSVSPQGVVLKAYWAMFDSLMLEDGIVKRKWETRTRTLEQVLVPADYRQEVLRTSHQIGHFGMRRMLSTVRNSYYWVGMHKDIRTHIRSCLVCAKRRGGTGVRRKAPLQTYVVGAPFERIAIDILGPFPKSDRGNRFVVVAMDYFTKWPEAFAVPDQTAETVAEGLVEHVVSRFGIPQEIHTDQGTHFESAVFQHALKVLGIRRTRTTPLHPQSNGMVERFNRTLVDLLSKTVGEDQKDWDKQLPIALLAYRATEHSSTGFSPAMLLYGRELALPVNLLRGRLPQESEVTDYARELQDRLSRVHESAQEKLLNAAENVKR
ncbi:unnamed protein product, partial [Nesidiocoris tenuis]